MSSTNGVASFYDRLAPDDHLLYADWDASVERQGAALAQVLEQQGISPAVQVWDWAGELYDLRLYLTRERQDGTCTTEVIRTRYYAITIERLLALMQEAGFVNLRRLDAVLHQPVLAGRRG